MKKQLFIFFAPLFFSLNIYSQAPRGLFVTTGYNQLSLQSSDLLTDKSNPSFFAGIIYNLGYHETYNFQSEFKFNYGTLNLRSIDNKTLTQLGTSKYTYSNFEFGFYFNYYILKPDEDKFFLGPQIGLYGQAVDPLTPSLFSDSDASNEGYLPYLLNDSALQDSSKFNFGTGLGLTGGYNNFRFDLRYSLGFSNLLKDVQTQSRDENNRYIGPALVGKVNSISFGISYNIFPNKK